MFIDSHDAAALAGWYRDHLGIEFSEHPEGGSFYVVLRTRDVATREVRHNPVFSINSTDAELAPAESRGFVINLRVGDLDKTIEQLSEANVEIEDRRIEWEGGKHAWIRDLDGNKVELYEELRLADDSPYHDA